MTIGKPLKIASILILAVIMESCLSDDNNNTTNVVGPIAGVDLQDTTTIALDETVKIPVHYEKPNDCYKFMGFQSNQNQSSDSENEYIITAVHQVTNPQSCQEGGTPQTRTDSIEFPGKLINDETSMTGTYTLKFAQEPDNPEDENAEPNYLDKTIIIEEEEDEEE